MVYHQTRFGGKELLIHYVSILIFNITTQLFYITFQLNLMHNHISLVTKWLSD